MKLKSFLRIPGPLTQDLKILNWKELGLKSPKLSKYLTSRAMPNRLVSIIINWLQFGELELTHEENDVLNQSVSSHFTTCQAPDHFLYAADEDVVPAAKKDLFLVVIRTPKGFLARAKVRRCLKGDKTVGWWVEPVYGHGTSPLSAHDLAFLLKEAGEESPEWLGFAKSTEHRWNRNFQQVIQHTVEVPSCQYGFQDSLDKYTTKHNLSFAFVEARRTDINEVLEIDLKFRRESYRTVGIIEQCFRDYIPEHDWEIRSVVEARAAMNKKIKYLRRVTNPSDFIREVTNNRVTAVNPAWGVKYGDSPRRVYGTAYAETNFYPGTYSIHVSLNDTKYLTVSFHLNGELINWRVDKIFEDSNQTYLNRDIF